MTFGWLTGYMWGVYRHGVTAIKDLGMAGPERSQKSALRYINFIFDFFFCLSFDLLYVLVLKPMSLKLVFVC